MSPIIDQLNILELAIADVRGQNYKDNEIEIEARFKHLNESGPAPLTASQFYQFKDTLSKMKIVPFHELSIDYISGKYRKTIIQKKDSDELIVWRLKSNLKSIFLDDYGIKIAINAEIPISNPPKQFKPTFSRTKDRQSYIIQNGCVRLDLTIVHTISEGETHPSYEIELELLDISKPSVFLNLVKDFWRILHGTEEVYTHKQLKIIANDIKKQLGIETLDNFSREMLVQSRPLHPDDLVYGGIVGNSSTTYSVTHKADGHRKILFFHKTGTWCIMPPYEYNWITSEMDAILPGTLLDGELIPIEKRLPNAPKVRYWYLAFDCLCIQYNNEIRMKPLHDRAQICYQIARNNKTSLLTITAKEHWEMKTPIEFFAKMAMMLEQSSILSYKTDGYMFTPTLIPYINNNHGKLLTNGPDIVKYKFKSNLTIDFSVKQIIDSTTHKPIFHLFGTKKGTLTPVKFEGTSSLPYNSSMLMHDHPLLMNIPIYTVVEFGWNNEKKQLIPIKQRRDKVVGNDIEIACQIWTSLFNPIPPEALDGTDYSHMIFLLKRTV